MVKAGKLKKSNYTFLNLGSSILMWWGISFTAIITAAMVATPNNANDIAPILGGTIMMGVAPAIVGWSLKRKVKKKMNADKTLFLERDLMLLAKQHDGILTVAETALELGINFNEAKELLDEYVMRSVCEIDSNDDGVIFYRFKGFLRR